MGGPGDDALSAARAMTGLATASHRSGLWWTWTRGLALGGERISWSRSSSSRFGV